MKKPYNLKKIFKNEGNFICAKPHNLWKKIILNQYINYFILILFSL